MSDSNSSSSIYNGVKPLTGPDNYMLWKTKMKMILMREGLWLCTASVLPTPTSANDLEDFVENQDKAFATILLKLDDKVLSLVEDLTHPNAVWLHLQSLYSESGYSARHSALSTLFSTSLSSCIDVQDYVTTLSTIFKKIQLLQGNLPDWILPSIMLHNLGPTYNDFVTMTLGIHTTDPDFGRLVHELIEHEKRLKIAETGSTLFHKSKGPSNSNSSIPRPKCSFCHKLGHLQEKCWKKNPSLNPHKSSTPAAESPTTLAVISDNSPQNMHQSWFLDTGASYHITNNKSLFINFTPENTSVQGGKGESISIIGCGDIQLLTSSGPLIIQKVRYGPKLITNLLSIGQLCSSPEKHVKFGHKTASIYKNNKLLLHGLKTDINLYKIDTTTPHVFFNNTQTPVSLDTWHKRLGHLNYKSISQMEKLVSGLNIAPINSKITICEPCAIGKGFRSQNHNSSEISAQTLQLLHTDLGGPITPKTFGGAAYYMTVTDDFSRYSWIFLLKKKDEAFQNLKELILRLEKESNHKVQRVRSDNGGEYLSGLSSSWFKQVGIKHETTVPYTPEQNGVSERLNRTLLDKIRSFLSETGLPKPIWGEAISTMVYLKNLSPTKTLKDKTPFQAYYNKVPEIGHLRALGCKVFSHIPKEKTKKLDDRSRKGYLVGYEGTHIFRIWHPDTLQTSRETHVTFDENHFFKTKAGLISDEQLDTLPPKSKSKFENNSNSSSSSDSDSEPDQDEDEKQEISEQDEDEIKSESESSSDDEDELAQLPKTTPRIEADINPDAILPSRTRQGHTALFTSEVAEPQTYKQAVDGKNAKFWHQAMQEEYDSLMENNTWTLVNSPDNRKILPGKWVYKIKTKTDGTITRWKARWVAKGYEQIEGLDYNQTFASVIKGTSARVLFALAVEKEFYIEQMDVKTAFLYGNIDEEIFIKQPTGFEQDKSKVCKLNKALYGLKQAPRVWYQTLQSFFEANGFTMCLADNSIFVSSALILGAYVDDFQILGKDQGVIKNFKLLLAKRFKMVDLGPINQYLGMEVHQDFESKTVTVNQKGYIEGILKKFNMEDCKPAATPMVKGLLLEKYKGPVDEVLRLRYQSAVGSLMYAMLQTRPDLCFAVSSISQYSSNPTKAHWHALKHIFRYLKGTITIGLKFTKSSSNNILLGYSDSDYAGDSSTSQSTAGYLFSLSNNPVSWSSKKIKTIALSSCEAEYMALKECFKEAIWLKLLLQEIGFGGITYPIQIGEDNQGAIALANNPEFHARTKHIRVHYHWIRQVIKEQTVELLYVATENMPADGLTKPLERIKFEQFMKLIKLKER